MAWCLEEWVEMPGMIVHTERYDMHTDNERLLGHV